MDKSTENLREKSIEKSMDRPTERSTEIVIKRDGRSEAIDPSKITKRLQKLKVDVERFLERKLHISVWRIAQATIARVYNGITTSELDEVAAEISAYITDHPDYAAFAGQILSSNLEANNRKNLSFEACMDVAYHFVEEKTGLKAPLITSELHSLARKFGHLIDRRLNMSRNYLYEYFAMETLMKGQYLLCAYREVKQNRVLIRAMVPFETPQHMWMRVALGIHGADLERAFDLYEVLSTKSATMATPTLFNAGTVNPNLSSCFLLQIKEDSLAGIYDTMKDCALISKSAGGIGLHIHQIRSNGSYIKGTNGTSNGIVPMLRVVNNTARYVDQCFHPDTLLYTKQGLKPFRELAYNDEILSHSGDFTRVSKVLSYPYEGPVWEIGVAHLCEPVIVTGQHPLWALTRETSKQVTDMTKRQMTTKEEEEKEEKEEVKTESDESSDHYVEVEHLQKGDYLGLPLPTYEADVASLQEKDCRMLGLLLGPMCLFDTKAPGQVIFLLLTEETHPTVQFLQDYLRTSLIACETFACSEKKLGYLTYRLAPHFPFTRDMLFDGNKKKIPHFVLHLPVAKIEQVVRGLMESHLLRPTGHTAAHIMLTNLSLGFMRSFSYLLLRLQTLPLEVLPVVDDLYTVKCSRGVFNREDIVSSTTESQETKEGPLIHEGMLYYPIMSVKQVKYQGSLMDLEMTVSQPNYATELGLAHNGGGKRKGSFAIYLEPWHADLFAFLDLKKVTGSENDRARDLFYALWIPDLFWKRVKKAYALPPGPERAQVTWSLMDPKMSPGLSDCWGTEFEKLYERYEAEGKYVKQVPIQEVTEAIWTTRILTGVPYMLNKDAANRKSNQKNLGTIKSSNLCAEIMEYSSADEIAVCNLGSISLPAFVVVKEVKDASGQVQIQRFFDYTRLYQVCRTMIRALNQVIDRNHYSVPEAKKSNLRHRPVGLGIQGLADLFGLLRVGFGSPESKRVNRDVAETMYFAALTESHALTQEIDPETGVIKGPYPSIMEGGTAPIKQGLFQFDLWQADCKDNQPNPELKWDWEDLRTKVKKDGVRNSLLIAHMPTASTSQILGNTESHEPYFAMIYVRKTKVGEFYQYCKPLIEELYRLGLWETAVHPETGKSYIPLKEKIKAAQGSIQNIAEIPQELKDVFLTVRDIKLQQITEMARDRALFIDQSMSLNVCFSNQKDLMPQLLQYDIFAWSLGLKTSSYYTRTIQQLELLNFSGAHTENKGTNETKGQDQVQVQQGPKELECESCSA